MHKSATKLGGASNWRMSKRTRGFIAWWRAILRRARTPEERQAMSDVLRTVSKTARQYFSVLEKY